MFTVIKLDLAEFELISFLFYDDLILLLFLKQKSHPDMTMYCLDNKMKLIIFENQTEEEIVQNTWGTRKCQNINCLYNCQSRKLKFDYFKQMQNLGYNFCKKSIPLSITVFLKF